MTRRYRATTFSIAVAGALAIAACRRTTAVARRSLRLSTSTEFVKMVSSRRSSMSIKAQILPGHAPQVTYPGAQQSQLECSQQRHNIKIPEEEK
jgi:hypothetical protein